MRVRMDDLGFYRWKIECLETQLKLHDKIQDALDALDPTDRPMVKKYFQRLDALLHSRELSFDGWVIFQNQLAKMIGREDLVKELDPTFKVLPERIRYYECKMEAKRMEIEFKATEFQERSLDQLDNDLIPVEALVSVTE